MCSLSFLFYGVSKLYPGFVVGDVLSMMGAVAGVILLFYYGFYTTRAGFGGRMADTNVQTHAAAMFLMFSLDLPYRLRVAPTWKKSVAGVQMFFVAATFTAFVLFMMGQQLASGFLLFGSFLFSAFTMFVVALTLVGTASRDPVDDEDEPLLLNSSFQIKSTLFKEPPRWIFYFSWVHAIITALVALCLILLCMGAGVGARIIGIPVRGTYLTAGGFKILYHCDGPLKSSRPTIVIDSDGSHGMMDFWPLQRVFTEQGRRSCIFDKPGIGFSDNFKKDQVLYNLSNFYDDMIDGFGERPPYTLLAWGGAGEVMYEYATRHPDNVASFVFISVYYDNIEWRQQQAYNNWTAQRTEEYRQTTLQGRDTLFTIIRGFGVPWGLMTFFIPANATAYAWPERYSEYRWFYLTAKTWTTQYFFFETMRINGEDPSSTKDGGKVDCTAKGVMAQGAPPSLRGKPVLQITSNQSRAALCREMSSSGDCDAAVYNNQYLLQEATQLATDLTGNGTVVVCSDDNCDLSMVYQRPDVIARAIEEHPWA